MTRFTIDGRLDFRYIASYTNGASPSVATDGAAGTDLVGTKQAEELVELTGWEIQTSTIPTPGMAGLATGNVGGEQTYPDSGFMVYKDDTSATIYSAQAAGTTGSHLLSLDGAVTGEESEIFGTTVLSRVRGKAPKTGHKFTVNCAIDVPVAATWVA